MGNEMRWGGQLSRKRRAVALGVSDSRGGRGRRRWDGEAREGDAGGRDDSRDTSLTSVLGSEKHES
jgi:hypothetical protein